VTPERRREQAARASSRSVRNASRASRSDSASAPRRKSLTALPTFPPSQPTSQLSVKVSGSRAPRSSGRVARALLDYEIERRPVLLERAALRTSWCCCSARRCLRQA
jgi:hypothetical protein